MNTYKVLVGLLLFGLVQTILFFTLTKKNSGITADGPEVYGNAGRRRRGGGNKYIEAYRRFKESYVPLKDYYVIIITTTIIHTHTNAYNHTD